MEETYKIKIGDIAAFKQNFEEWWHCPNDPQYVTVKNIGDFYVEIDCGCHNGNLSVLHNSLNLEKMQKLNAPMADLDQSMRELEAGNVEPMDDDVGGPTEGTR